MKLLNTLPIIFILILNTSCAQEKSKNFESEISINNTQTEQTEQIENEKPERKIDYNIVTDKNLIKSVNDKFQKSKSNKNIVIGNGYVYKNHYVLYGGDYGTNEFYELKVDKNSSILKENSIKTSDFWKIQNELKTYDK